MLFQWIRVSLKTRSDPISLTRIHHQVTSYYTRHCRFSSGSVGSNTVRAMAPPDTAARGSCLNFDHITFWVSNAKQAASYYVAFMGFRPLAYKGLETGSREYAAHAVVQDRIVFLFVSALTQNGEFSRQLNLHGDFVRDIAFTVDDVEAIVTRSKSNGATLIRQWQEQDADGIVKLATISTIGDTTHTFVERSSYRGLFLPGFREPGIRDPSADLPPPGLQFIDHCVATRLENSIESTSDWYQKNLSFHRFWSVDDVDVKTTNSSLKFLVVANNSETIKLTILEPASGRRKSQVQEFNEYNGGTGIQHIALHTENICQTVANLRQRGIEFLDVPPSYYELLREKLTLAKINVKEDLKELEEQKILLDFDDRGYLLQIFTKPMQDRPTLFLEIIQRRNHNGFGAGNFTTLFLAVEREQEKRGNLSEIK